MKRKDMLDRQIVTFNENIIGLRDFITLIGPFIEEHHNKAIQEHKEIVQAFNIAEKIANDADEDSKIKLQEELKAIFDGQVIEAIPIDTNKIEERGEVLDGEIPSFFYRVPASINLKVEQGLKAPKKTTYQKELLYKNAFIGLLSSVEWFYSQVLHYYYDKHPEAAGIKKKTMTLEDLKSFSTVEDAEKYLIDSKIEEIFRGGFDGWIDLLKEEVKLKITYVKPFYNELLEVYQRRNLLVHNGGIINSIYMSKVSLELRKTLKIGDKLNITAEYIENAICKLHLVFTLIAAELWKKLEPNEEMRAVILNSIAYDNMVQKRWEVSEWISSFIKDDDGLKSRVKTIDLLNYWLSKKNNGSKELVVSEISKADFTDKSLQYQLAIAALTDNTKEFFELLPETLRTKSLEVDQLISFPIFEEMRALPEFEEFKKNSSEFKELKNIQGKINDGDVESNQDTLESVIDKIIEESRTEPIES